MVSLPISFYYVPTCFGLMNLHYGQVLLAAPNVDGAQKDAIDTDMKQYRSVQIAFVSMIFIWASIYSTAFTFYGIDGDKLEEFVGLLCGIHGYIYNLKYTPQLYIIWRKKDVSSIMPMLMIMDLLSSLAWAAYGYQLQNTNIMYPNIVGTGYGIVFVIFYLLYKSNLPVLDNKDIATIPMVIQTDNNMNNDIQPATKDGFSPVFPLSSNTGDSTDKDDVDIQNYIQPTTNDDASPLFSPLTWVDDAMINLVNIGRSRANTMLIDVQQEQEVILLDASLADTVDLVADTVAQDPIGISSDLCPQCSQYLVYNSTYCWSCGTGVGSVVRERRTTRSGSGSYSWDSRSRASSDTRSRNGSTASYNNGMGYIPSPVPKSSVDILANLGNISLKIGGDNARQELERISEAHDNTYEDKDSDDGENDKNV